MKIDILFVAALGWEAKQVVRHLTVTQTSRHGVARLWRSKIGGVEIAVVQTGVGRALATQAITWAVTEVEPCVVLVTGCAGAMIEGLVVGDVIVARDVVQSANAPARVTSETWSERYLEAAGRAFLRSRGGTLFTSADILSSSQAKRDAAARTGAIAVDMETGAIFEWAVSANLPFAAARVILDDAGAVLPPELAAITRPDGSPDLRRLFRSVIGRPAVVRDLLALGASARICRAALSALHGELLRGLSREPSP